MMTRNGSQMIRKLLVCGCVLSSGLFAAGVIADSRGDSDNRNTASDRSSGRGMTRDRSSDAPRRSEANQQVVRPGGNPTLGRAPEIRTDSRRLPAGLLADADNTDRQDRHGDRTPRPDTPRVTVTPRGQNAPSGSNAPSAGNPSTARVRDDTPRTNNPPPPPPPPVVTDRPRTITRDDTTRRDPKTISIPDRDRTVTRGDSSSNNSGNSNNTVTQNPTGRIDRNTPVVRGGTPTPKVTTDAGQPVTRSREDVAQSIARPRVTTDISGGQTRQGDTTRNMPNIAGSTNRGTTIGRTGTGVTGAQAGIDRSTSAVRSNSDVARSIARPQTGSDRFARQTSDTALRSNSGFSKNGPVAVERSNTTGGTMTSDRSLPISRTRDSIAKSISRSPISIDKPVTRDAGRSVPDIARTSRGIGQLGTARTSQDSSRITRDVNTRTLDGTTRGISRDGSSVTRGISRQNTLASSSAVTRDGTIRTASFRDSRTVARGTVAGHDVFVRTAHNVRNRDVYVLNAGHFRPDHWPHGDYRPDHGEWHHGDWRHGDWHHGDWDDHHHWSFDFTFVHSYYAPAGAIFYDVVPVAPVVYYAAPVYSFGFSYISSPGVVVSAVRYVEPVVFAPPAMVVYPTYYAAPVVTSVVYSPIVAAPVVAPVAVPVVTPVCAPVYYYYPAYAYYPVYTAVVAPTYVVEPAPVVAAPAVVETPSSGWSISTAFSFLGHHGKSFAFGASFSKARSTTIVAPAVVAPAAPAVAATPAEASPATDPQGQAQAAPTGGSSPAQATLESGLTAIRSSDMQKARNILSQVVVSDPDNGMARMLYSAALTADGQYKEAAESLRRSLETWPDFQLKDFYLPAVYDNPKVFTQTMRDVREFLSDHPGRDDAWLLVSWSYAVSGQSDEAVMLLNEARKSWPEDAVFASLGKAVQANEGAEQASASAQ